MIRLRVDNSYSYILDPMSQDELKKVSEVCSYFVKGAQFTPAYQSGSWDGRKRLFNEYDYSFPTGMVSTVRKILPKFIIEDVRKKPKKEFNYDWIFEFPLRDYQLEAVKDSIKAQRGVILSSTASGKTIMAMKIIHELGVRTLFLVNTKEALYDAINCAEKCFRDIKVGVYGDSKKSFGEFLTIATVSSIIRYYAKNCKDENLFLLQDFKCIFGDEIHHVGSPVWFKAFMDFNSFYKYGLTGTGFRMDGGSILLQAFSGRVICDIKAVDLQAQGYLAQSDVYFINIYKPDNFDQPMPYPEVYKFGIVRNEYRNKIIGDIIQKHINESKLIIVEKIEHGEILLEIAKKIDKDAVFISGTSKHRDLLKKAFEEGHLKTVIASRIYNESADVPIIEVVVDAAGGKSGIAVIQKVGRSLRIKEGKESAKIYGFLDRFNLKLEEHSIERMRWLKKEGHKIKVVDTI